MLDGFANMKSGSDYTQQEINDIFYTQATKASIKSKESDITVSLDGEPIGFCLRYLKCTKMFCQ